MRAKILITLLLAAVCAASQEDWDAFITPIDKNEPNSKFKFTAHTASFGFDRERFNAALNNPDPRVIDDITIFSSAIEDIRRIFEVYGKQATKLRLGAANITYKAQDLFDAFNLLPNLEELRFYMKDSNIEGEVVGTLNLKNLHTLELAKEGSIFLSKILPENILKDLTIYDDENYGKLLEKQQSIKSLIMHHPNPVFTDAFRNLKLDHFNCDPISGSKDLELISNRRNFIKAVIATQPDLKNLVIEFSRKGYLNIMNDEFLVEISKLSNLENIVILMEGSGLSNFEPLGNLKNLKDLTPRVYKKSSIELVRKLSNVRFESLEDLDFNWCYLDLPADVLEGLSQNMPNLKKLRAPQDTFHSINFYAKNFPQIEDLTIRFGDEEGEGVINFDTFYDKNIKIVQPNLKILDAVIANSEQSLVNVDDFFEFLKMFPNLETLDINTNLPFTAEFFTKLADNLNKIKILKIGNFLVKDDEKFDVEASNAMKAIAQKLKFFGVLFYNEDINEMGNIKSLINTLVNSLSNKDEEKEKFSYQPLIDQVKDVFNCTEDGRRLKLKAGDEDCENIKSRNCYTTFHFV